MDRIPDTNPWVMSCGCTSGAGVSGMSTVLFPDRPSPVVTPSAPGYFPKRLSKVRFSFTRNTMCLMGLVPARTRHFGLGFATLHPFGARAGPDLREGRREPADPCGIGLVACRPVQRGVVAEPREEAGDGLRSDLRTAAHGHEIGTERRSGGGELRILRGRPAVGRRRTGPP